MIESRVPTSHEHPHLCNEADIIGQTALKKMVNFLAGTFYVINQAGRFVMWNNRVETATAMSHDEIAAVNVLDLFNAEQRPLVAEKIRAVFEHEGEVLVEAELLSKHGLGTPYLFSGSRFECNHQFYLCGMGLDMSERRQQDEQLRLRERALHVSSNGIVVTRSMGGENLIDYVNPAFERITGYLHDEVYGHDCRFLAAPGMDEPQRAQLKLAILEHRETSVVFRNLRKNGELFWNELTITPVGYEGGKVTHFIGVLSDVTASKQRTSDLEHDSTHDPLTGLANRNLLVDRLEQGINLATRNNTMVATVLLDLDNFKEINDSLGHDFGDEILKAVAQRLLGSVREIDTVARLGGDEFVLVLVNQPSLAFTMHMIGRLRASLERLPQIGDRTIAIGSSMGVSIFPHDGATVAELIRAADAAMYQVKSAGRNDVHFFSEGIKSTSEAEYHFHRSLRLAIENDQLRLLLQPKICLRTNRIVGAEALLRWHHPERGMLLPAVFLPVAEHNGMLVSLGSWVLETACGFGRRLLEIGFPDLVVSVNVSLQELSQKNYVDLIAQKLDASGLPAAALELEIREADLMRNLRLSKQALAAINRLGLGLTVDAFGEGPSILSELTNLPIRHLKISRSLIDGLGNDGPSGTMTRTVIAIGQNLSIGVIAEGVENVYQNNFLRANGCDEMLGNYISEPVDLATFEALLCAVNA